MNIKIKQLSLLCLGSFIFFTVSSCDSFLDHNPDERAQLDTKEKIKKLLVSAYPIDNYSILAELSGDNFIDNNNYISVVQGKASPNLSARYAIHNEIFKWQPVVSSMSQDSPTALWQGCYKGIAVANEALAAIRNLESQGYTKDLSAEKGEALICRAYCHFVLVNIFCEPYKDQKQSMNDLGIPYSEVPEEEVVVDYPRGTVTEVYNKIAKDIEEGFKYIDNDNYTQIKYHFNKKSAAAFATRFYLYKRDYNKVIEYANYVLGNNLSSDLRDWSKAYTGPKDFGYDYIKPAYTCNLLIIPTRSQFSSIFGSLYGHNGDALNGSINGPGPSWNDFPPAFKGKIYVSASQDYGAFIPKYYGMFEYIDPIAGTGYQRVVRVEFTTGETLLCRAEAKIFLGDLDGAIDDLQLWSSSYLVSNDLTIDLIKSFYKVSSKGNSLFVKDFNSAKLSSEFIVTEEQKPFIDCVLHFRRIETIYEGLRWFDIKRYGIEITHASGADNFVQKLTYDDPRRAIQLPGSVIAAGMEPNPRNN